jgi:aspartokinase
LDITAAYWEPQIKTYGFWKTTGLSLVEMKVTADMLDSLGQELVQLGDLGIRFCLVFTQVSGGGAVVLYLLIQREWEKVLMEHVRQSPSVGIEVISPVDMISFQGPHFGERFGILDAAFQALSLKKIRVIASVCSMSCVYLVFETDQSERAASALSEAFDVPKAFPLRS